MNAIDVKWGSVLFAATWVACTCYLYWTSNNRSRAWLVYVGTSAAIAGEIYFYFGNIVPAEEQTLSSGCCWLMRLTFFFAAFSYFFLPGKSETHRRLCLRLLMAVSGLTLLALVTELILSWCR